MTQISAVLSVLAVLATAGTAVAQTPDEVVVRWTAHVDAPAAVTADGSVEVVLEGRIERGWNLYALNQDGTGLQPLSISLGPLPGAGTHRALRREFLVHPPGCRPGIRQLHPVFGWFLAVWGRGSSHFQG